jgi:hypothetical protein
MRNRRLGRFLIQFVRWVSLPFPFAILLSIMLLEAADRILRPDRSNISSGDPGEYIGGILLVVLVVVFQALIGLPSLILLDRCKRGLGGFLAIASIMSLLLSAMLASALHAPQFGESFGWMFSRVLAFVAPPFLLSFLLAYILRPRTNQNAEQAAP